MTQTEYADWREVFLQTLVAIASKGGISVAVSQAAKLADAAVVEMATRREKK